VDGVTTVLEGQKVSKTFGGAVALTSLDFHLRQGEILGLIGPNGAGKTTLINIVSGHLRAGTGEVKLHNRVISSLPAHEIAQAGIARTFQTVRPFMGMTVEENILVGAFFGATRRVENRHSRQRVDDALAFLSLTSQRHDPVDALTIADRKRVELARALAMEPQVLLLDELMAGLNASEMDRTIGLVREINGLGVSLIIVEHVMEAVVGLCERVMVLHHGEKIADGPTRAVLDDSRVIEAYLGSRYRDRLRSLEGKRQGHVE
jgi:branched-chain amino acid transport system ATP-binding protein